MNSLRPISYLKINFWETTVESKMLSNHFYFYNSVSDKNKCTFVKDIAKDILLLLLVPPLFFCFIL